MSYIQWVQLFKPNHEVFGVQPSGKTAVVGAAYTFVKALDDGESVGLEEFIEANFEEIKTNALSKINSSSSGDRRSRPNRVRETTDDNSVASGGGASCGRSGGASEGRSGGASEGGGAKKFFSHEDCKTFHTTKAGPKLLKFLKKQGDSSAAQMSIVQQYLDHVKEVEKVSTIMDSESVSDEVQISFANMTLTQLGFMKKEMLNLKWNTKSAIVLELDGFVEDITALRNSKS